MQLLIKNMVCNRCIRVVREDLENIGLKVYDIGLGFAEIEVKVVFAQSKAFWVNLATNCEADDEYATFSYFSSSLQPLLHSQKQSSSRFLTIFLPPINLRPLLLLGEKSLSLYNPF